MAVAEQNTKESSWWDSFMEKYGDYAKLSLMVSVVLTFIVGNVIIGLYCFGIVQLPKEMSFIIGAISFAYAAWMLGLMVVNGVQWHVNGSKRRK